MNSSLSDGSGYLHVFFRNVAYRLGHAAKGLNEAGNGVRVVYVEAVTHPGLDWLVSGGYALKTPRRPEGTRAGVGPRHPHAGLRL